MTDLRILSAIIQISALYLTFVLITETKDFCESYRENNYRITYGFRTISTDRQYFHYIFIDQYYWRFNYTDSNTYANKTVNLVSSLGQKSNWFGKDYSMAFCVWINQQKGCKTMLFSVKDAYIDCGFLDSNEDKLDLIGNKSRVNVTAIDWDYKLGFVPIRDQMSDRFVTLVKTDHQYKTMRVSEDCKLSEVHENLDHELNPENIKNLNNSLHLMAVLAVHTMPDEPRFAGEDWTGMILLFQNKQSIVYCISYIDAIPRCYSSQLKTLINCTDTTVTTTVPGPEDPGLSSFWILIISAILVTIILIICALIGGLIWLMCKSKNEETLPKETGFQRPLKHSQKK